MPQKVLILDGEKISGVLAIKSTIRARIKELHGQNIQLGEDGYEFFCCVYSNHHRIGFEATERKIQMFKPRYILPGHHQEFHGHCVGVIREDGSKDDPSWRKAIVTPRPIPPGKVKNQAKIINAMRQAIQPQVVSFRTSYHGAKCAMCLCENKLLQTDHHPHLFQQLVNEFLGEWKTGHNPLPTTTDQESGERHRFTAADAEFQKQWIEYHKGKAGFRWLCKECHKKHSKESRVKATFGLFMDNDQTAQETAMPKSHPKRRCVGEVPSVNKRQKITKTKKIQTQQFPT